MDRGDSYNPKRRLRPQEWNSNPVDQDSEQDYGKNMAWRIAEHMASAERKRDEAKAKNQYLYDNYYSLSQEVNSPEDVNAYHSAMLEGGKRVAEHLQAARALGLVDDDTVKRFDEINKSLENNVKEFNPDAKASGFLLTDLLPGFRNTRTISSDVVSALAASDKEEQRLLAEGYSPQLAKEAAVRTLFPNMALNIALGYGKNRLGKGANDLLAPLISRVNDPELISGIIGKGVGGVVGPGEGYLKDTFRRQISAGNDYMAQRGQEEEAEAIRRRNSVRLGRELE